MIKKKKFKKLLDLCATHRLLAEIKPISNGEITLIR